MSNLSLPVETIYSRPENVQSRFVTADGYRTHYLEAGDPQAEPLVLVHGGGCEIGMATDRWYPTILPLAATFRTFAVDEVGYGETDPPRDPDDLLHVRVRAEHVIAFIEALGVGPVYLLGQSEGGWIVTYISLTRPDLVRRLVLVDSGSTAGSGWSPTGERRHLAYFDGAFLPGTMVPKHDLTTRDGVREMVSTFVYDRTAITDVMIDRLMVLSGRWNRMHMDRQRRFWADPDAWRKKYESYTIGGTHISERVETMSVPTLVVWGKQSNKGVDNGVKLFKKIPGAQLHIFDAANHFVWLDQPRAFPDLVTWFLGRHAG